MLSIVEQSLSNYYHLLHREDYAISYVVFDEIFHSLLHLLQTFARAYQLVELVPGFLNCVLSACNHRMSLFHELNHRVPLVRQFAG